MQYKVYESGYIVPGENAPKKAKPPSFYVPLRKKIESATRMGWCPPDSWKDNFPPEWVFGMVMNYPPATTRRLTERGEEQTTYLCATGNAWYAVMVVEFADWFQEETGVKVGVVCKEQLLNPSWTTKGERWVHCWGMTRKGSEYMGNRRTKDVTERGGVWTKSAELEECQAMADQWDSAEHWKETRSPSQADWSRSRSSSASGARAVSGVPPPPPPPPVTTVRTRGGSASSGSRN